MTESPLPNVNPGMLKLGGVALAAYLLGRMKKGRAAIGLAMWAAGMKMDPKELLRQGVLNLASSDQGKELIAQLRGPALEAGRKAATATIEGQMAALTSALEKRTQSITSGVGQAGEEAGEQAGDAAEKAGGTATGLLGRRKGRRKDQAEAEEPAQDEAAEESPDDEESGGRRGRSRARGRAQAEAEPEADEDQAGDDLED